MYFIGLDVGTTGCKAAIFDQLGHSVGKHYEEFDIICRRPVWAEQSPAVVLSAVKRVLKEAVYQAKEKGVRPEEIVALSTSVLGEEVMPVDRNFQPLRDAILGMDYRASAETEEILSVVPAAEAYDITGFPPHPMGSLPTILWMRKNEPELLIQTDKYVTFTEYIMKCLGAEEPAIDYPQAGRTMAFDINQKKWSDRLLKAAGMTREMLCKAVETGQVVGRMSKAVARELGLAEGLELVAGGQDQTCAALGAGLIDESIGMDSHGTIEGIGVMSKRKLTDESMLKAGVSCYAYTIADRYFLMSASQVGGLLLKWYKNNFSYAEVLEARRRSMNVYDVMTEHAPTAPSSIMVLPHFIGSGPPWNDLDSKGAIVGLTIDSTRHDVVKAVMDSLTYEFKINMLSYEQMGFHFNEMRVVGGVSKSSFWMQLKANILNRNVSTLKEKDAACLGAAMIAMYSKGIYDSLEAAVKACVMVDRVFRPDATQTEAYERAYQKYIHLYDSLRDFNHIKI